MSPDEAGKFLLNVVFGAACGLAAIMVAMPWLLRAMDRYWRWVERRVR